MKRTSEDSNVEIFKLDGAVIRNGRGDQWPLELDEIRDRTVGSIRQELDDPDSSLHHLLSSEWGKDSADQRLSLSLWYDDELGVEVCEAARKEDDSKVFGQWYEPWSLRYEREREERGLEDE